MQTNLSSSRLVERDRYFREFAVWPVYPEFNTDEWISNFLPEEKVVAERLLTNFSYFNERMTDALLRASIQNYFSKEEQGKYTNGKRIDHYINETAFVICEGENPHPADSGNLFARKLRDKIHIPETNIKSPKEALEQRVRFKRFIFIDDFCGSGNQFETTWNRQYQINGEQLSFQFVSRSDQHKFAYCCCISTWKAKHTIEQIAPAVILSPAHQLVIGHSAIHPDSNIWRNNDVQLARRLIREASARAGYTAEDNGVNDWRGFHALGLTLAFNHGIPDASLPIFYSSRENWKPLIPRI